MIDYFELSKERYLLLRKTDKNLTESEKEELDFYNYVLPTLVYYNSRFQYFSLLENYMTGKIDFTTTTFSISSPRILKFNEVEYNSNLEK